ncbi:MAG: NBR1-Ig-like domain-containing protein [Candidatus Promineifilaceae bacterium]
MTITTYPVIDFHGPSNGCGERLRLLTAQGKATCVKALDGGGWAFEAAKLARESNVPHIIIFRQTAPGDLADDHPDLNLTPEAAAEKLWHEIMKKMPPELLPYKDLIYVEPTNEPGVVPEKPEQAGWVAEFCVDIANIMLAEGWNPALAGFNAGTPSVQQVRDYFVPLLRLIEANWDRCLWTLHEAKLGGYKPGLDFETDGLSQFVPDLINSSQRVFGICDELGIRRPRTFISEFAWSHNDIPGDEQFRREVHEAALMDAQWPEVVGRTIYTTHSGAGMWGTLRNKLNNNSKWLTEYVTTTTLKVEEANPAPAATAAAATAGTPIVVSAAGDAAEPAGFDASIDLVSASHPPGTTYQATWRFKNSGQTTWNGGYSFVFSEEASPQTAGQQNLPLASRRDFAISEIGATDPVKPGDSASLTLDLTLPLSAGTFSTNWQMQTPDGHRFGPIRWATAQVAGDLNYDLISFNNSAADFDNLQPGRQFSGTWLLRNSGRSAWPGDTRLVFVNSHRPETEGRVLSAMGAPESATLQELTGSVSVLPGETIEIALNFVAPQEPGQYAFNWQLETPQGDPFGGLRWMGVGVAGVGSQPVDSTTPGQAEFGMNVNINDGHAPDAERMHGLSWVRYVYWASRKERSPQEAFTAHYQNIMQQYAHQGIKSLLVLHQDTEWGNGPWNDGDWETYAGLYADACARVARACAPFRDMVAYQIFNETDSGFEADAPFHNPSAIGIPPEKYALLVDRAAAAIRAVDPAATIVLGGMKTGPDNAVNYLKIVEQTLGKPIPVDAITFHPYGRWAHFAPFDYGQKFGTLQEAIRIFHRAFPNHKLWITEVGVPGHQNDIDPKFYGDIARYMEDMVREIADNQAETVPVFMWFAWHDVSEKAGIVDSGGQMKDKIGDAFQIMVSLNRPTQAKDLETLIKDYDAQYVSYDSSLSNHNAVPAGTQFSSKWTFRNVGMKSWGAGCRLVYAPDEASANNDPMCSETSYDLADVASPMPLDPDGETVVELTLTAPEKFGREYSSRWELRDPDGNVMSFLFAKITVVPALTAGTRARRPEMVFIDDKTVPDGTRFTEGDGFDKQWLVRNTGSRHWGEGFRLVYVDGDRQMARGIVAHRVPDAAPDEEVILTVPMTAPPTAGPRPTEFRSTWRLQDDYGNYFGQPLWAQIVSLSSDAITAYGRFNNPAGWYSQIDPAWRHEPLGNGMQTIGSWGCLMTCMAMMLSAYGRPHTPLELNNRLKSLDPSVGFDGSVVQFAAPEQVLPGIRRLSNMRSLDVPEIPWTEPPRGIDPLKRIDDALAVGDVVLAQVDHDRNNAVIDQHWVILLQRTPAGDDYDILDPFVAHDRVASQPLSLMTLYGNAHPSRTAEENLLQAIKSALVYQMPRVTGG